MEENAQVREETVIVSAGEADLEGNLTLPEGAVGVILFAHGSGSSRKSPRNRFVAGLLNERRLATLLMDLLTWEEERRDVRTAEYRFDIGLLADRLAGAIDWLVRNPGSGGMPIGCFGASTGGGAALVAAARRPEQVKAVVSRGGRPDLAGAALPRVKAPTLLIVGGEDREVIELNQRAMDQMSCQRTLQIVPGATHLFEEPGALERVAWLAGEWFTRHLA